MAVATLLLIVIIVIIVLLRRQLKRKSESWGGEGRREGDSHGHDIVLCTVCVHINRTSGIFENFVFCQQEIRSMKIMKIIKIRAYQLNNIIVFCQEQHCLFSML